MELLLVFAAVALFAAPPASAQTPKRVVYLVRFGTPELTQAAVGTIQGCCGDFTRADVATGTRCPDQTPCEFLFLTENGDNYIINSQMPGNPEHPKVMPTKGTYGSRDPARRRQELLETLQSVITCHEKKHGVNGNPTAIAPLCQICGKKLPPPTTQSKAK